MNWYLIYKYKNKSVALPFPSFRLVCQAGKYLYERKMVVCHIQRMRPEIQKFVDKQESLEADFAKVFCMRPEKILEVVTMSRLVWREPWQLGDSVSFEYCGERLYGEIVRTSSNPTYFHVEVGNQRYEVDMYEDKMEMENKGNSGW